MLKLLINLLLLKSFFVAERVERLSNSLGQEIIYNVSNGKTKNIKQLQLGVHSKSMFALKEDGFIWFLATCKSSEFSPHKQVPGWTGFYYQVLTPTHDNNHPSKMFYFPSTAQPPTKIRTVQEVLYQVKKKSRFPEKQGSQSHS